MATVIEMMTADKGDNVLVCIEFPRDFADIGNSLRKYALSRRVKDGVKSFGKEYRPKFVGCNNGGVLYMVYRDNRRSEEHGYD